MAIASETVTVDYPIGDVFDFLVDGSNNSLWRPEVVSVIFAAGPTERAVWAQTVKSATGKAVKADYRISRYDRPGKLELTVFNGPSRPTSTFTLKSLTSQSTQVSYAVDVKPLLYPFERTRYGTPAALDAAGNIHNLGAAMAARARKR
ncbi:MAG TPA: SRPBCC family protein [Galbitalea sp.]|nr:SRPBCC family protein [Galbitalea sp.]